MLHIKEYTSIELSVVVANSLTNSLLGFFNFPDNRNVFILNFELSFGLDVGFVGILNTSEIAGCVVVGCCGGCGVVVIVVVSYQDCFVGWVIYLNFL